MITLSTDGKTIDTGPAARLITEGEKNADVIQIEMPVRYGTLDLAALTWVLAGVTDRETRVEQELAKDTSGGLTLQWTVTGDWAAVPGRMRLELSGISADGAAVIKFTGNPIEVRPAAEIYGLPRPELSEQYLETMRELVEQAREAADALANAGLKILGYYDSLTALAEAVTNPQIGDLYGVGPSGDMYAYVWDGEKWAKGQTLSAAAGAVSSVFGRAGDVTAQAGDYTAAQVGAVDGATGQGSAVRISNRNLLDNGDFRNPVNQRGQTSYTGNRYGIDRWKVSTNNSTAAVSVGDGWINFTSDASGTYINFSSTVEKVQPGNYTLSFLVDDYTKAQQIFLQGKVSQMVFTSNLLTMTFSVAETSAIAVGIQKKAASSTLKIYAAKLELGSVSTLAHQENGVWVLNDPLPNYAEELAKCQRYFLPISVYCIFAGCGSGQNTSISCFVPTPCEMRIVPSLPSTFSVNIYTVTGAYSNKTCTVENIKKVNNGFRMLLTSTQQIINTPYGVCGVSLTQSINADANL